MNTEGGKKISLQQGMDDSMPGFDSRSENRDDYINALESALDSLKQENVNFTRNNLDIRSSIDELVAMQHLSNSISTAVTPEAILDTLIELTRQVIPVIDSNIFLFDSAENRLLPLSRNGSLRLQQEAQQQLESGIVDWVFSEKKTVIVPDLEHLVADGTARNFVMVPLMLRNKALGIYFIHTVKNQQEFSNQDIQLLTVLANQAAAGVENWRTYEQLLNANKELKSSEAQMIQVAKLAAIGELAASIVHEIKNPVQVLVLQLDMMQRGFQVPNGIQSIRDQVLRLSEITKRLMNFARNVSEEFLTEAVNVNKPISDVVAMVQYEFRNEKIEIKTELGPDLPLIQGNGNYLQQVFLNLMINARDAMPSGGTITITSAVEGMHVVVGFADTGCGIPKELQEKIFEPFFTTKSAGKGTGLGLPICRKIIQQHQGKMRVQSAESQGIKFIITLPIRRSAQ